MSNNPFYKIIEAKQIIHDVIEHLYVRITKFNVTKTGLVALVDGLWYSGKLSPNLHAMNKKNIEDTIDKIVERVETALRGGGFTEQNSGKIRKLENSVDLGDFLNEIESQRRKLIDDIRSLTEKNCTLSTENRKELNKYCKSLKTRCSKPCTKNLLNACSI
jgi:hypothetical protein